MLIVTELSSDEVVLSRWQDNMLFAVEVIHDLHVEIIHVAVGKGMLYAPELFLGWLYDHELGG
jgi:hypothetical protein